MEAPLIVIVGAGSVGKGLKSYLIDHANWNHVEMHDPPKKIEANLEEAQIIHVTVPYLNNEQYDKMWKELRESFHNFPMVIIHSTINPEALRPIFEFENKAEVFYCPIRVPETTMEHDIGYHIWLIAPIMSNDSFRCQGYLRHIGIEFRVFQDPFALAYGKLMETSRTAMEIAFAQMMQRVCQEKGWDFKEAYYEYTKLSHDRIDYRRKDSDNCYRPIFFPGKIGGKCLMQNLTIVDQAELADNAFLEFIMESNDKVVE